MRRIAKRETRSIQGVRLYLEDYYALVEILQRGKEDTLQITADDYELDDPDEIKQMPRVVVQELILAISPLYYRLSVNVQGSRADVTFSNAPDPDYGRALEILELLKRKRFLWGRLSRPFFGAPLIIIASVPYCAALMFARLHALSTIQKVLTISAGLLPVVAALSWMMWRTLQISGSSGVALLLKDRSQSGNFVERHKDTLVKAFISMSSAIAGALIKALFDK